MCKAETPADLEDQDKSSEKEEEEETEEEEEEEEMEEKEEKEKVKKEEEEEKVKQKGEHQEGEECGSSSCAQVEINQQPAQMEWESTNHSAAGESSVLTIPASGVYDPPFPRMAYQALQRVIEYIDGMQTRLFTARLHTEVGGVVGGGGWGPGWDGGG